MRDEILTPAGRFVQGSLYEPQTTGFNNDQLIYRTGPKAGEPRVKFYLALAIQKGPERHWAETEWGAKIWELGHKSFPDGQAQRNDFAWKIVDGDSPVPNANGRKPCDIEGYPGHWVLNFQNGFAVKIYNVNANLKEIVEPGAVNPGDYIQVFGYISDNGQTKKNSGIFLNHTYVGFLAYGDRINTGKDVKQVGFGNVNLPQGASLTPKTQPSFNPAGTQLNPQLPPAPPSSMTSPTAGYVPPVPTAPPQVQPYPDILNPQNIPQNTKRIMTPQARYTYQQYIDMGFTDISLIQNGLMLP